MASRHLRELADQLDAGAIHATNILDEACLTDRTGVFELRYSVLVESVD